MKAVVKDNGELGKKIHITVPAEAVRKSFDKRLRETSKKIRLPGFRAGKVPPKLIEEVHGEQIFQEVTSSIIENSYQTAIAEKELNPAGMPDIKEVNTILGEDLEIIASVEVFPEFEPVMLEGETLEKPTTTVSDADVEDFLLKIRRDRGTWVEANRPAAKGDRVKLRLQSEEMAKLFGQKKDEPFEVIVGEVSVEGDLDDKLQGVTAKNSVTVHAKVDKEETGRLGKMLRAVKLQKQYRTIASEVNIDQVEESQLAPLDEDFFTSFGMKEVNVDVLKETMHESMDKRAQQAIKNVAQEELLKRLVEKNLIPLPEALVKREIEYMREKMLGSIQLQDEEAKKNIKDDLFREQAEYNVRSFLVVDKIAEKNKFDVDNNVFEKKLNELTASYEDREKAKSYYRRDRQARHSVRMMILQDQVLELLTKNVRFTEKECPVTELVGFNRPAFL